MQCGGEEAGDKQTNHRRMIVEGMDPVKGVKEKQHTHWNGQEKRLMIHIGES